MNKKTHISANAFTKRSLKFLNENKLNFIVFLTGACVLVVEVLAVRILAPYFGNTIYSVSSILAVILGALSLGYYFGGKKADNNPSLDSFFKIIWYGGLSTLFLEFLALYLLPVMGYSLHPIYGPFIASLFLFLLPSYFLGMLSPYAIKLQSMQFPEKGVGKISGEVFFTSTLGSIFGSLITGFYLVPSFGVSHIVTSVGIILSILGLIGSIPSGKKKDLIRAGFLTYIAVIVAVSVNFKPEGRLLYLKDGVYGRIAVYDAVFKGRPARILAQDDGFSSGSYSDSDELAFDYTKYYSLYEVFDVEVNNALFIGGGAYSVPNRLIKELPEVRVDVVEVEPDLFDISKTYFRVSDSPRLNNIILDGRRYLHDTDKSYDLIFADAYASVYSVPVHLATREFFQLAYNNLNPNGIFLANIIGDLDRNGPSLVYSEMKTFNEVFKNSYFFAVDDPNSGKPQNIIFVGVKNDNKLGFRSPAVLRSDSETVRNLEKHLINLSGVTWSNYPTLTDDFAPTEYLGSFIAGKNKY